MTSSSSGGGGGPSNVGIPGGAVVTTIGTSSNPASALVASSRPPIPLAPRLTPASTSQQTHSATLPPSSSQTTVTSAAEGGGAPLGITASPSPAHGRSRHLIHRASQPIATQALNVETSPPAARFSAYIPRPSHGRYSGNMNRMAGASTGVDEPDRISSPQTKAQRRKQKPKAEVETAFEVLPQFRPDAHFPGDVLVRCSGSDFYVHRAVLYFASPFFQAVLDGDWKETHPSLHSLSDSEEDEVRERGERNEVTNEAVYPASSSTDTHSSWPQPASMRLASSPRASFYTAHFTLDNHDVAVTDVDSSPSAKVRAADTLFDDEGEGHPTAGLDSLGDGAERRKSVGEAVEMTGRLQRLATPPPPAPEVIAVAHAEDDTRDDENAKEKSQRRDVIAIIDLSEEEASTFQDVLCLVYPNLDLLVTWYNIFPLFSFSDKFEVPHLRRACTTFLRAALAGRPIEAMALGERHGLDDIYREASRHVLENMPAWEPDELEILSSETLLKLERKRTWFLERLLKLGLANPARDYECHAACPDPPNCARMLHERWRSQYANAFKYGPPQPSIIWRHLRELESIATAATATAMSACQSSSKAWVQLLFDRMYGLPTHGMTPPKFLSIKLDSDYGPKPRRRPAEGEQS